MLDINSRAPKQLGDFGEGLVTYALIRKGFEVACVDHVGADLICEKEGDRLAVSVKTRMFRAGSVESRYFSLEYAHVEKLEYFSHRFGLAPVIAHAACVADEKIIHLFMITIRDVKRHLKRGKHGYRLSFAKTRIEETKLLPYIDYSSWSCETFSSTLTTRLGSLLGDENFWPLPTPLAVTRMLKVGHRFDTEDAIQQQIITEPNPDYLVVDDIHPAADAFLDELYCGGWVMEGWDYCQWADKHFQDFKKADWIESLSLREIQQYFTWYSRMLRNASGCPVQTVSHDVAKGWLPAFMRRIELVQNEALGHTP